MMTIIDKVENMPIEFVDDNGNKGYLEFRRGACTGPRHIPTWQICYMDYEVPIKIFESKQFEEVVILAFEWFRKNKPELIDERRK